MVLPTEAEKEWFDIFLKKKKVTPIQRREVFRRAHSEDKFIDYIAKMVPYTVEDPFPGGTLEVILDCINSLSKENLLSDGIRIWNKIECIFWELDFFYNYDWFDAKDVSRLTRIKTDWEQVKELFIEQLVALGIDDFCKYVEGNGYKRIIYDNRFTYFRPKDYDTDKHRITYMLEDYLL